MLPWRIRAVSSRCGEPSRWMRLPKKLLLLCIVILCLFQCCTARFAGGSNTRPLTVLRGGTDSLRFGRTPPRANKVQPPFSSSSQQTSSSSSDSSLRDQDEKMKTKEMLDAFLTRDSRNTFIGE